MNQQPDTYNILEIHCMHAKDSARLFVDRSEYDRIRKERDDAQARISWQDAEIEGLQKQNAITEAKFLRLCKDFDARDAELKRVIATQRVIIDVAKDLITQQKHDGREIAYRKLAYVLNSAIL